MGTLSKTICLGVIILALQVIRGLKFPGQPRIVLVAAKALGVSRKSGYQAASRIRKILESPETADPNEDLRQEVLKNRIKIQVLTFERDHPGIRFEGDHGHLPPEARSLCVRLFRDFKGQLSSSAIARCLGVPLPSLIRWDLEADPNAQFPEKPERRGIHRRAGPEDIERVIALFKALTADVTLEEFTEMFNKKHPDHPLDRRTITRILQSNGLKKTETRDETPTYHPPFQVYFPGAQVAIDGHQNQIRFTSEPNRVITFNNEIGIDIASCAVLGNVVGKTENSDGVERVQVQIREECMSIIAILSDNGSANRAVDSQAIFRSEEDPRIFSFPCHPQTNGYAEGFFGQFSRLVGNIVIDDRNKETIALSVVKIVWRIFIHFHNYSPRERLGGKSTIDYLRNYVQLTAEVEEARKGLQKQREKSRASREKPTRTVDPKFQAVVKAAIEKNRIPIAVDKAVEALLIFDLEVVMSASAAFFAQSSRPDFDEKKRNFPYFFGIARNKQRDLDASRARSHHLELETARKLASYEEAKTVVDRERRQEEEDLRSQPEKVLLGYCDLLLRGKLKMLRNRCLEGLRKGLDGLRKQGRATRAVLEGLAATIRSWGDFQERYKEDMVKLLFQEGERVLAGAG